jgi:hypothetical protein
VQWERKSLAQAIKYNLDDERREALYTGWDINNTTKERKLQLVHKVGEGTIVNNRLDRTCTPLTGTLRLPVTAGVIVTQ